MNEEVHHRSFAWSLILIGCILILARSIDWDIWVVLGLILIIKGFLVMTGPLCCPKSKTKPAKKKK